ncbi:MAG: helix-turn-helix domain-containing protein, partial [Streptosporangiaceae bacterium]
MSAADLWSAGTAGAAPAAPQLVRPGRGPAGPAGTITVMAGSKDTGGRSRRVADQDGDNGRGASSALRHGLRVLEAFSIDKPVLGVTEIAQHVGLHKSTVSRILAILEQAGYVERNAESGRFRLGLELIALAGP